MDFVLKRDLENPSLNLVYVDLIFAKKPYEARKIGNSKQIIVIKGINDDVNRAALENKYIDVLLNPGFFNEKDFMHSRNSGLNQVLCKLAKKNDIAIGFGFSDLIHFEKKEILLGRMMQNISLCRKFKVKMVLGSFANKDIEIKNKNELMSFGKIIGMDGREIKESLNFKKKEEKIRIEK